MFDRRSFMTLGIPLALLIFFLHRYEKCQEQIQGMCLKVCTRFQTFAQLVTMDFFMPVVDLCLGKKKVTVCKVVIEAIPYGNCVVFFRLLLRRPCLSSSRVTRV